MRLYMATWPPEKQREQVVGQQLAQDMIYLAERDPQHHAWAKHGADKNHMKLRILISYHYYKDIDLDSLFSKYFSRPYPDVFADSGAFSAFTQGIEIDPNEYAAWVKRWEHLFSTYANLDVIGDDVGTAANQQRLEDKGLSPLPVFHVGEPWKVLEKLIDRYGYIALGGMVPHMRFPNRIMPWLIRCFKMAGGKSVFHGFGATSWVIVKSLPWYSVDSSSWGSGFRYGQVPLFDEKRGRFVQANLGDPKSCFGYGALFRSLGFNPEDFAERERNDRAKICAVSALSYMKAEQWLRKRHGEIHIPKDNTAPAGLRTHLVTAASTDGAARGGNMSINALGQAEGLRLHLVDARPKDGGDLAAADEGLKIHLSDGGGKDTFRHLGDQA